MKLIIIQGGAATGKSTLANQLAKSLKVDRFFKDHWKEKQFDAGGKKATPRYLYGLEEQSYKEVYAAIARAAAKDKPLIVEGNFLPFRRKQLAKLVQPNCTVVEIYCYAKGWLMLKRFIHRRETGKRHKIHVERPVYGLVFLEALCAELGWRWYRPLRLSKSFMRVNTSKPHEINYEEILNFIEKAS